MQTFMQTFNALLLGPGLPADGSPVDAGFSSDSLWIASHQINIEAAALRPSMVGGEQPALFLHWQDKTLEHWALKVAGEQALALVRANAPAVLAAQLSTSFKPGSSDAQRSHFKAVMVFFGAIFAICTLVASLAWWQYDHVMAWAAGKVPAEKETMLGNAVLAKMKLEKNLLEQGLAVNAVKEIGQRLTKGSRYRYQWLVKQDKTLNAFALPGGIIVVHSGLLAKMRDADELAAVLAHEVQHVEQRHALKRMINQVGISSLVMLVMGDITSITSVLIQQSGNLYFSRDNEDEADRLAYQTLVQAGIRPDGMVGLLQKLEQQSDGKIPTWISSHPATSARIAAVQERLKTQPCPQCQPLSLDWKAVQNDPALRKE
jgi:Zn-dependent protease with chaperone function